MIARFLKKYWREDTIKETQHLLNISRLPCYVFYIDLQILIQVELEDQQTNIQIPCVDTNTNRKSDQKTKSLHLHFVGDALPLRKNLPKSQRSENISSKYRLNTNTNTNAKSEYPQESMFREHFFKIQIKYKYKYKHKIRISPRVKVPSTFLQKNLITSLQYFFYTAFNI